MISELIHLAVSDEELREELRRRGRARLDCFSPAVTAARMRETLEELAPQAR